MSIKLGNNVLTLTCLSYLILKVTTKRLPIVIGECLIGRNSRNKCNTAAFNIKTIRPIEKKNTDKSSQQTITTMFQAMKRKLTPGKADDASQDNQKMQRNDLTS